MDYFRLLVAVLATYRLAQFVSLEDGPFDVFKTTRVKLKSIKAHWGCIYKTSLPVTWTHFFAEVFYRFWRTTEKLVECPFCTGVWFAALTLWLASLHIIYADLFLLWLAIAGGQSFLQEVANVG